MNENFFTRHLQFYCERTDTNFWSEPVNALSNIWFLIVGIIAFYLVLSLKRKQPKLAYKKFLLLLPTLIILTGLGSFLFHTSAQGWSHLTDIGFIFIFQMISLYFFLVHMMNFKIHHSVLTMITFLFVTVLCALVPPFNKILNGSLMYFPSLVFILYSTWWFSKRQNLNEYFKLMSLTSLFFTYSLIARTVDQALCTAFPLGTHYIWHILNAIVLFFIFKIVYMWSLEKSELNV